jgi:curved DNA-binding protein CbpA
MGTAERDHYAVLGISRDFTAEQLKSKYHELAREHHPDRNHGNEEKASDAFKLVQVLHSIA